MEKLKLTAGGQKFVSECIREKCPVCLKICLLHPDRWKLHIRNCCRKKTAEQILEIIEQVESELLRNFLYEELLLRHNGTLN